MSVSFFHYKIQGQNSRSKWRRELGGGLTQVWSKSLCYNENLLKLDTSITNIIQHINHVLAGRTEELGGVLAVGM